MKCGFEDSGPIHSLHLRLTSDLELPCSGYLRTVAFAQLPRSGYLRTVAFAQQFLLGPTGRVTSLVRVSAIPTAIGT